MAFEDVIVRRLFTWIRKKKGEPNLELLETHTLGGFPIGWDKMRIQGEICGRLTDRPDGFNDLIPDPQKALPCDQLEENTTIKALAKIILQGSIIKTLEEYKGILEPQVKSSLKRNIWELHNQQGGTIHFEKIDLSKLIRFYLDKTEHVERLAAKLDEEFEKYLLSQITAGFHLADTGDRAVSRVVLTMTEI